MPLISTRNLQQGSGRPAKYGPLPSNEDEMYPMRLEEITHRIKYFKGHVVYMHVSEYINQPLGIRLPKPDLQTFIEDMDNERLVFSCYYKPEEIDALIVTIFGVKPVSEANQPTKVPVVHRNQGNLSPRITNRATVDHLDDYYQTPEAFQAPVTKKDTEAAYDSEMNPIAVKIAPGQWKMGHKIMNSDGKPVEFKKGYNPLRDENADEFFYMHGYAHWEPDEEVWILHHTRSNGSRYPEIPEDSIYRPLEGQDPLQFPVASTIRRSYGRTTQEQTYEEQQTTDVEDIQVQRHYLRQRGKDPDKMGPAYALPKGVYDLPDDWVDPETDD